MTATYDCIATTTLANTATEVLFTGISGSYTDLVLVASGSYATGSVTGVSIQVGNNTIDTSSNYSATQLDGDGTIIASYRESNGVDLNIGVFNTSISNSIFHFLNYANTTTNKTFLARGNCSGYVRAAVGLWRSTSAINQIRISNGAARAFTAGSTFSLYGIKAE